MTDIFKVLLSNYVTHCSKERKKVLVAGRLYSFMETCMLHASANILIVDDHPSMRRTIADIMRMLGYFNIHYAEDGFMALEKLQENKATELILLDWNMPKMTGLSFLRRIRSAQEYEKLPVIMITAEAEQQQVIEAVSAGVTSYIVKPFTPITLQRKINEVFP